MEQLPIGRLVGSGSRSTELKIIWRKQLLVTLNIFTNSKFPLNLLLKFFVTHLVVGLLRIQNSILTKPLKPKALVNTLSQLLSTQNHKNHSQKSAKNTQYFN